MRLLGRLSQCVAPCVRVGHFRSFARHVLTVCLRVVAGQPQIGLEQQSQPVQQPNNSSNTSGNTNTNNNTNISTNNTGSSTVKEHRLGLHDDALPPDSDDDDDEDDSEGSDDDDFHSCPTPKDSNVRVWEYVCWLRLCHLPTH